MSSRRSTPPTTLLRLRVTVAAVAAVVTCYTIVNGAAAGAWWVGVAFCVPWVAPGVIYALVVRSVWGSVVLGVLLYSATAVFLHDILTSRSSTAGLGLLFLPIYLTVFVAVGVGVEGALLHLARHRHEGAPRPQR